MIRIITFLVVLCILLGIFGAWSYKNYSREKDQVKELTKFKGSTIKELQYYKNKSGLEVAKNEVLVLSNKNIRRLYDEGNLKSLEEFNKLKRNYRNLENYIKVNATSHSVNTVKLVPLNDSTKQFSFQDNYSNFLGFVTKDTITLSDSLTMPLSIVVYWDRKWFLARKKYYVEVTSENKAVKITGIESIKVIKK
jgi:hypothetical protein